PSLRVPTNTVPPGASVRERAFGTRAQTLISKPGGSRIEPTGSSSARTGRQTRRSDAAARAARTSTILVLEKKKAEGRKQKAAGSTTAFCLLPSAFSILLPRCYFPA